jgi:hypothetical protein
VDGPGTLKRGGVWKQKQKEGGGERVAEALGRRAGAPGLAVQKIRGGNLMEKKMMLRINRKGMEAAEKV